MMIDIIETNGVTTRFPGKSRQSPQRRFRPMAGAAIVPSGSQWRGTGHLWALLSRGNRTGLRLFPSGCFTGMPVRASLAWLVSDHGVSRRIITCTLV